MSRSIAAANDGGRWVFEVFGKPYPFEDQEQYRQRLKRPGPPVSSCTSTCDASMSLSTSNRIGGVPY